VAEKVNVRIMKCEDFQKWFNHDFWRAFKNHSFPIAVPDSPAEREATVRRVYESIDSARYAPSIPEAEIIRNKGFGVARTIPVFCIEDYIVYYFCIKELEDVLCGNRTPNTFGGWTLGGKMRSKESEEIESEVAECRIVLHYGSRLSRLRPLASASITARTGKARDSRRNWPRRTS
jgi:hypothetical protein